MFNSQILWLEEFKKPGLRNLAKEGKEGSSKLFHVLPTPLAHSTGNPRNPLSSD
jgi:hypothetical protein